MQRYVISVEATVDKYDEASKRYRILVKTPRPANSATGRGGEALTVDLICPEELTVLMPTAIVKALKRACVDGAGEVITPDGLFDTLAGYGIVLTARVSLCCPLLAPLVLFDCPWHRFTHCHCGRGLEGVILVVVQRSRSMCCLCCA